MGRWEWRFAVNWHRHYKLINATSIKYLIIYYQISKDCNKTQWAPRLSNAIKETISFGNLNWKENQTKALKVQLQTSRKQWPNALFIVIDHKRIRFKKSKNYLSIVLMKWRKIPTKFHWTEFVQIHHHFFFFIIMQFLAAFPLTLDVFGQHSVR